MSIKKFNANNYGSIRDIQEIIEIIRTSKNVSLKGIKDYSIDQSINLAFTVDAIIELLLTINWVELTRDNKLKITDNKYIHLDKQTESNHLANLLTRGIFAALKDENILTEFIDFESLDIDMKSGAILVLIDSIPLQYSGLRKLLKTMMVFNDYEPNSIFYQISDEYQDYFTNQIVIWLQEEYAYSFTSGLSFEEFKRLQKIKEELGNRAEEYVVFYEQERLKEHPYTKRIKQISKIKINAGFDVASFDGLNSRDFDRFIEVKSFTGNPEFYWSDNEIRVAEIKKEHYFLYLVDRNCINEKDYQPIIIQNPFEAIYHNEDWLKNPTSWKITKKS